MSVDLEALNSWTASRYRGLAAPDTRPLLERAQPDGPVVALGASVAGEPAGLAVARSRASGAFALEWLYVGRQRRGRGLGTALLGGLEEALAARDVPALHWFHVASAAESPELERWLSRHGWIPEATTLRVFECSGHVSLEAWLRRARIPASFDVFSWGRLSARRRTAIERRLREASWVPETVAPWNFPALDPVASVGVSRNGEIVGWMLTQPVSQTRLRYAALCARPDLRATGLGHQLLAEAIRRQVRVMGVDASGIFTVSSDNTRMLRVVERRLKRHVLSWVDLHVMSRALARPPREITPPEPALGGHNGGKP